MMGYSGYGGTIMWLTLFIIGGGIVYFAFIQSKKKGGNLKDRPDESPLEIVKKRYAKGEITKEEFEDVKNDLKE
jgi:putative membrane protein